LACKRLATVVVLLIAASGSSSIVAQILTQPTKVKDVAPIYPEEARLGRIEGDVVIEAMVGVNGTVTDAKVVQSIPALDQAAIEAVRQWQYTPTQKDGVTVPVIMTVTVHFALTPEPDIGRRAATQPNQIQPSASEVPDERFRSDIRQLLEATGFERQSAQLMTIILTQLLDEAKRSQPDVPAGALEVMKQVIESEFVAATKGPLLEETVAAYAKYFTPDDVRGLLAFYNSELGKRTVAVTPAIAQELAASGQRWAENELPRIRAGIAFRLRKEGFLK
jgi:TonB family protein